MLPIPPKQRHRVDPVENRYAEKERKKSKKAADELAQRFKDMKRLAEEPEEVQHAVRRLQKKYTGWRIEEYIAQARSTLWNNRRGTTTPTTGSVSGPLIITRRT